MKTRDVLGPFSRSVAMALGLCAAAGACRAQTLDSILVGDFNGTKIVRLAYPSGTAQSHFVGNGMTLASAIESMTFGPDGSLYFTSYNTHEVYRVNGTTGFPFGGTPLFVQPSAGGLSHPIGMAFGTDGRLYVASFSTNAVLVYDGSSGAFINAFVVAGSGSLTGPWGIAFHGGNLYVCSATNAKVLRYNGTTGAFIDEAFSAGQGGLTAPHGITFDSGGRMYVTGGNAIYVKDPVSGVSLLTSNATIPLLGQPQHLIVAPDGSLLVPCRNGTVQKVDRMTGASLGTLVQSGAGGMTTITDSILYLPTGVECYANCDASTTPPVLNIADFICFQQRFAAGCN
jgi:DNA-binding beta-propeller fold protein YncE